MKRYVILAIFLIASLTLFTTNFVPRVIFATINGWPDGAIIAIIVFFTVAPTAALLIIVYDAVIKCGTRLLHASVKASLFAAWAAVFFTLLGVPFLFGQLLEIKVRAALAMDIPVASQQAANPGAHLKWVSPGRYADRCDFTCRRLLLDGRADVVTRGIANSDTVQSYALRTGETCLDMSWFTMGRDRPLDYNPGDGTRPCIIAVAEPGRADYTVLVSRMPEGTHLNGTITTITPADAQQPLFHKTQINPRKPFPLLGLVDDPFASGGIRLRITRTPTAQRTGIEQNLTEVLRLILP